MKSLDILGWREWAALPELGISRIKCKVDTGARSSAIHASEIEVDQERNLVQFKVQPTQGKSSRQVICTAALFDERVVTDSGGNRERRFFIETPVVIGAHEWAVEMSLTDRDTMRFRMLLGRTAMKSRFIVNPAKSYLVGKKP